MNNPFLLPPRSIVSFSGGRTSGLMLRRILDAFGERLPDDRKVIFCNTGKEREETLKFVERCSQRWDVPIIWLEYRIGDDGKGSYKVVNFETASRNGGPFEETFKYFHRIREAKGFGPNLPNPVQRFCTFELKLRTSHRYVTRELGWEEYTDAVGLRADEPKRVARARKKTAAEVISHLWGDEKVTIRGASGTTGVTSVFPLFDAGITESDVMEFWAAQDFDLGLQQHEGNCDLCFLKSAPKINRILRERPELADWWAAKETETGQRFRKDRPGYAELKLIATEQQAGPGWLWADDASGACGEIDECRCTD